MRTMGGRWCGRGIVLVMASLGVYATHIAIARAASPIEVKADGQVMISGTNVGCRPGVRTILDARLPNLGIATRNLLVMNPSLLQRYSPTVRLFVFHHECGHHHVGGDELGADCWAVKTGVSAGWLTPRDLPDICRSFGAAPETPTHPSSIRRCAALKACFSNALRAFDASPRRQRSVAFGTVRLVRAPQLVREGRLAQP